MRTLRLLTVFLTFREKFLVALSICIRLGLVALDLAGIFLVGVVVSLISGTTIARTSPLSIGLSWLRNHGFPNGYAVILGISIGFFILKGILAFALNFLTASYVGRIESAKAKQAYAGLFVENPDAVSSYSKQDLLHGLTNSMNAAFGKTITVGAGIIGEIGLLLGVSLYLATVNWALFIFVAAFFGAIGMLMQATIGTFSGTYAKRQHESFVRNQGTILDSIANFKQLALVDSSAFVNYFSIDRAKSARASAVYNTISTLPRYITEISVMLGVGILVLQRSSPESTISASTVAIFLAGIFRIVASMVPLQSGLSYFKHIENDAKLGFELIARFGVFNHNSQLVASNSHTAPTIKLDGVDFSYPGLSEKVLQDVSITIPMGSYCAVVGSSGAGKSTLVDLILGLHLPSKGEITIDGLSPRKYIENHKGSVGYVPQNTTLITGSLLENITMRPGLIEYDPVKLAKATEMANISDFIAQLPEGLATQIGADGVNLSGGQTQRIGLARALYSEPSLLVLDEATSALDEESELAISSALDNLRGATTIIVIAHRPSTLRAADRVLSVKFKRVTAFDSYGEYKTS